VVSIAKVRLAADGAKGTYDRTGNKGDEDLTWELGTGDRCLHDKVVASLPRTPFIVGGSLSDDAIRIRTSPAEQRRFRGEIIRFDSIIAPDGTRLNGKGMEHHLITAKVLINVGLIPRIGWCSSDLSIKGFFRSYLLMLRWMAANGIPRMAALKEPHYRLFEQQLVTGGLEALYPVLPMLDAFLHEVKEGREALPTYLDGGRVRLSMDALANRFGFARGRELSGEARKRVLEVANTVCPEAVRRMPEVKTRLGTRKPPGERLTIQRVSEILEPWERLHDLRMYLNHDEVGYRAYTPLRSREMVASELGRETGRTRDIPYEVLGFLLDRSLRWLDYAEWVKATYDEVRAARNVPGFASCAPAKRTAAIRDAIQRMLDSAPVGPGAPSGIIPEYATFWGTVKGARKEGLDLRTVLTRILPGACFVLIATFSARRRKELESLSAGCVERDGDPWLRAWIGKNVREVGSIPVPECVARAVEILEWLSEDGREITGEPWLFSFQELAKSGNVIEIKVDQAINAFAQFVGLDEFHDGPPLALAPHQFRRAFAIIHFYRFKMPSLAALSEFLAHYNSEKTARYLSEAMIGAYLKVIEDRDASEEMIQAAKQGMSDAAACARAFEEVAEEFLVDVLVAAEQGREPMVGKGGKALMLELEHFLEAASKRVTVTTTGDDDGPPNLDEMVRNFVQGTRTRIVHNPGGTSSCLCGSDPQRLSVANCLKRKATREGEQSVVGAKQPDFAYAEPGECADCYNGVQLPEHQKWMEDYITGQREVARTATGAILCNAAQQRADKLERFRKAFYEPADRSTNREPRGG